MESLRCCHGSSVWDLGLGVCPYEVVVTKSLGVSRVFEVWDIDWFLIFLK